MRYLLALLLLSGCAHWQKDAPDYKPSSVRIIESSSINKDCNSQDVNLMACTFRRLPEAVIYIRDSATGFFRDCYLSHEFWHVLGYNHDIDNTDCKRGM